MPITKSGYLYVYVSNETPNIDVFFDNLQVTHIRGPLLESNEFYPFGMRMQNISYSTLKSDYSENKIRFNGYEQQSKEFGDGSSLDWYDYKHRFYDYQLGRFFSVDMLANDYPFYTPYQFAGNQVPNATDLDGLEPDLPYYHPNTYQPVGTPKSFTTSTGNPAESYLIRDGKNLVRVAKIHTDESVSTEQGQTFSGTNYYFIGDPTSVNPSNTISKDGSTMFLTEGTNWHFWQTNHDLSSAFKTHQGASNLILGSLGVGATLPYSIPAAITASPYLINASRVVARVLKPQIGVNFPGAGWDFINQKVIQGRSWGDVNMASIITSGAFRGGNIFSQSIWSASGNFVNLSISNISSGGSIFSFNSEGLTSFVSSAGGNLFGNVASKYLIGLNADIIVNAGVRRYMNTYLDNASQAAGTMLSNVIQNSLTEKNKEKK